MMKRWTAQRIALALVLIAALMFIFRAAVRIEWILHEQDDTLLLAAALAPGAVPEITIDGDMSDWPDGGTALGDEHWLYVRIDLPEAVTIQADDRARAVVFATGYFFNPLKPPGWMKAQIGSRGMELDFVPLKKRRAKSKLTWRTAG